jgi:ketosteroid isomerase-like protein
MSQEQNARIAGALLAALGAGAPADEISVLFSTDVQIEIDGDVGALPWIGRRVGRRAVADFVRNTRELLAPVRFAVESVLADDGNAVIVGELASGVRATGKLIETAFAIALQIRDGEITRFRMLEDSFAVSRAARP